MSDVVPNGKLEAIEFFELRGPVWEDNSSAVGLSVSQAQQIVAKTAAARTAYEARQAAFAQAKAATITQNENVSDMRAFGSSLIEIIRAFAKSTNNPRVFATAQIPPPADPTPQPPENPSNVTFDLLSNGRLEVKWKGKANGGSAAYIVSRAVQPADNMPYGSYEIVGITGNKSFVDVGIPACSVAAKYVIKATKGTYVTPGSEATEVRFVPAAGSDPAGLRLAA